MKRLGWLALLLLPLFVGCSNNFNPNTATLQYEYPWHKSAVSTIDFNNDGSVMASGCNDGQLRFFNQVQYWEQPLQVKVLDGNWIFDIAFSPDGKEVAVATDEQENNIHLFDAATGEKLRSIAGHDGVASRVLFSPDGKQIISGGGWDGTIKMWNSADGSLIKTLEIPKELQSLEWCPDGSGFVSGTGYKGASLRLWSYPAGELVREYTEINGDGRSVAISPDSKILAGGSYQKLTLWDLKTGKVIKTIEMIDWVYSLAFSPDGKWLAAGDMRGGISYFSTTDWSLVKRDQAHRDVVADLKFTPDGEKLWSSGYDNALKGWYTIKKKYVLF